MAKKQEKKSIPIRQSEATHKSATDFGEASRSASRIRKAFAPLVRDYGEENLINRLNKSMIEVLKAIPATMAGARKFADGYLKLLCDFRFNPLRSVGSLWAFPLQIELNPAGLTFQLSKFHTPTVSEATHVVFQLMIANLDVMGEIDEVVKAKDFTLPIDQKLKPMKLTVPLNLNGERALLIAVGIHHLNDSASISNNRTFACDIIYAEHIKDGQIVDFKFADQPPGIDDKPLDDEGLDWEVL